MVDLSRKDREIMELINPEGGGDGDLGGWAGGGYFLIYRKVFRVSPISKQNWSHISLVMAIFWICFPSLAAG